MAEWSGSGAGGADGRKKLNLPLHCNRGICDNGFRRRRVNTSSYLMGQQGGVADNGFVICIIPFLGMTSIRVRVRVMTAPSIEDLHRLSKLRLFSSSLKGNYLLEHILDKNSDLLP